MEVIPNYSLQCHNTFGIDEKCFAFAAFESVSELEYLIAYAKSVNRPFRILGGGSNILLTQFCDCIIAKNNMKGIEVVADNEKIIRVKAAAGELWHDLVMYCVSNNFQGIENMALIPGTCGAAPIQNIGAYGVELKDFFVELTAIEIETGITKIFIHEDCAFGYRDSIFKQAFKGRYVILDITLQFNKVHEYKTNYGDIISTLAAKENIPSVMSIAQAVIEIRQSKLPDYTIMGNAGSFFKNPELEAAQFEPLVAVFEKMPYYRLPDNRVKVPAGWLIEQCGWKGYKQDNCGVHDKQALVLINLGKAKGKDVYNLSAKIIDSVRNKFDIVLEREVNIW